MFTYKKDLSKSRKSSNSFKRKDIHEVSQIIYDEYILNRLILANKKCLKDFYLFRNSRRQYRRLNSKEIKIIKVKKIIVIFPKKIKIK